MSTEPLIDLTTDYHLDLLATGVVLLDANLRIRALNHSAENLLEISASRALGIALEELLDESNDAISESSEPRVQACAPFNREHAKSHPPASGSAASESTL